MTILLRFRPFLHLLVLLHNILKPKLTIFILNNISSERNEHGLCLSILNERNIIPNKPKMDMTDIVPNHLVLDELANFHSFAEHSK